MTAKCHLYDIVVPDPSFVKTSYWFEVLNQMDKTDWFGEMGHRYGFVSTLTKVNLIIDSTEKRSPLDTLWENKGQKASFLGR